MIMVAGGWRAGDRHGGARGPREVGAGAGADRDGTRPVGRGAAPRADHRPGVRLDDAARRGPRGLRRRARSRALRAEHAGRRRTGARGAARGGGRRRLDAAVGRAPGRHRRGRHQARPARGHPQRPGRCRPGDTAGARLLFPAPAWVPWKRWRSSAVTGAGLPELRDALARLVAALPAPDPAAPVRLWVDRSFSIRGSGTVVTGTLPAGTVTSGQELLLTPSLRPARIRGLESLNEPVTSVAGVTRVAVNLRGVPAGVPARGMALIEAGRWTLTRLLDVRLFQPPEMTLPAEMTLHIGSARTQARVRPLGSSPIARLTLRDALPLHVGDRVLLRDPGSAGVAILGATVLDVAPPALTRRGAAAAAGASSPPGRTSPRPPTCCAATASCAPARWPPWASPAARRRWRATGSPTRPAGPACAASWPKRSPPTPGATRWPSACRPRPPAPPSACPTGRWSRRWPGVLGSSSRMATCAPGRRCRRALVAGVRAVLADLAAAPFVAPEAGRLRDLGLDPRAIAAAARAGLLLRVTEQIVLAPGAEARGGPDARHGCRSRSPPPRPGRRSAPPGGSRSRCSNTWTGPGSPSACPTTAAACGTRPAPCGSARGNPAGRCCAG